MCNFYAVYLRHPGSAEAYCNFCRANALTKGVHYFFYPKPYEFPRVFQEAEFGVKYRDCHFLGVLYFGGDAAFFPKEYQWTGVILDHVYTQSLEANAWLQKRLAEIYKRGSDPVAVVQRRVRREEMGDFVRPGTGSVIATQEQYWRAQDRWNREDDEIKDLVADHKEQVDRWKRQNFIAIGRARKDRERLEKEIWHRVHPGVLVEYDRWVKANPSKTAAERREFLASLRETRFREMRYQPDFRHPMDLIEQVFAGKPHKSPELKERIKAHREEGERLNQWRAEAHRDLEQWKVDRRAEMPPEKRRELGY